ncbi:hypothetical protein [Actinomadura litoris]|uniref:hypothetical protein n=1 Tax=Actinomadura litoris TaxID=2678616 RepID=UPI001FA71D92|nr:hypothetical protein [Actinomadura litoris]
MTPQEELLAAAELVRKRGTEATPGPWERPLNTRYKNSVLAAKPDNEPGRYLDGRPERVTVVMAQTWSSGAHMRERNGRDLEWITLMHPGLAEPLAAWLDDHADDHGTHDCFWDEDYCPALRLARAINKPRPEEATS